MSEGEPKLPELRKTLLSVLIVLAATTGALVSWQASRLGSRAATADGQAITAALNEAGSEMSIASDVFLFETNARELRQHVENARAIHREVMRNPAVPVRWLDEWQSEIIRARVRHLQLNTDFLKMENGQEVFDSRRYGQAMRAQAASKKPLDSTPFANQSEALRRKSVFLVALNLLFTSAIFLFTVALRTDIGRKLGWMTAGIVFYACGIGLALDKVLF